MPVTNVPAFAAIAPVKVARPPVAIGDPVAGEKSNCDRLVGVVPTAGMAVNSEAAVAVLRNDRHLGSSYDLSGPEALHTSEVAEQIVKVARTGRIGDGKVFVVDVALPEPLEF